MDEDAERSLCAEARDHGELLPDGTSLIVGTGGSLAGSLGRIAEQRVFDQAFGGHSAEVMAAEYRAWESVSLFVTIVDSEGPCAAYRLIWSPSAAQPTKVESDLDLAGGEARRRLGLQADQPVWEHATWVVEERARRSHSFAYLLGESAFQMRARYPAPALFVIAIPAFRTLRAMGFAVKPIPGTDAQSYLGAVSQPGFAPPIYDDSLTTSRIFADSVAAYRTRFDDRTDDLIDLTDDGPIDGLGRSEESLPPLTSPTPSG